MSSRAASRAGCSQRIEEFSKDVYKVDVLKVEFPVTTAYVRGSRVFNGQAAYDVNEALDWFRAADAAARRPYIYLSAGVTSCAFLESLRLAVQANARFSGVICGRANWQGGVQVYVRSGPAFDLPALTEWLSKAGLENIRSINQLLGSARPWHEWFGSARV